MRSKRKICFLTPAFLLVCMLTASIIHAEKSDTPEAVMAVAKQASIESADIFVVAHEANSFLNRLSSDRSFASKFLEAVQKNDTSGVVSVVKQTAPRSQISVIQLRPDFFTIVQFKVKTRNVSVCLSGANNCSGHAATVDLK